MKINRIFFWIARINSVLLLVLLLTAVGFSLLGVIKALHWDRPRDVAVVEDGKEPSSQETLTLGDIAHLCGHDVKYVELRSEGGRKLYSYSSGRSQTRNVIFFSDNDYKAHWLFESNHYQINTVQPIPYHFTDCDKGKVSVMYYELIKEDSNHDGRISDEDDHTIGISDPTGRNFRELVTGVTKVLDYALTENGHRLSLLLQMDQVIVMRDYSVEGELLSEIPLTELSAR